MGWSRYAGRSARPAADAQGAGIHGAQRRQLQIKGGFKVISQGDVVAVIGLERQRQLLGCADDAQASCAVEIASGLGVDALITGSLSKTTSGYLVNLRLVRASDASGLAVFSGRPKSEEELLDFLEQAAGTFAAQYGQTVTAPAPAASSPARVLRWVALGATVVSVGLGATLLGMSRSTASQLTAGTASSRDGLVALRQSGQLQESLGWSLLGAALVLAALTVIAFVVGSAS